MLNKNKRCEIIQEQSYSHTKKTLDAVFLLLNFKEQLKQKISSWTNILHLKKTRDYTMRTTKRV